MRFAADGGSCGVSAQGHGASIEEVKIHVGPVACGPIGTCREQRFDLFGDTVMTAALLPAEGCAVTPELRSRLKTETVALLPQRRPPPP